MKTFSFVLTTCILVGAVSLAAEPIRLVHRWEHEPDLGTTWLNPPSLHTPILRAGRYNSPLQGIRLNEAQLAIRNAENPRLQGGAQSLPILLEQLHSLPENRPLRLSLAAAAIALADRDQAKQLWEMLHADEATRPLIERALVDWKLPLALENWRKRLRADTALGPDLLTAIEGVGATGDKQDQESLQTLLRDDRFPSAMKIVIARALAHVSPAGLESLAQDVLAADLEHRELVAAELLSRHTTDTARDILAGLVKADSLPAQQAAYGAIAENFPELAREQAGEMLSRPDNNLRLKAVEVLNRFDDAESLRLQAVGIADRNSLVRNTVRENLLRKAELPELRGEVDEVISFQLEGKTHEGANQAILMAVALREPERCPQLLVLLEHPHLDTTVFAAWALQELAETPEVAERIFELTQPTTQRLIDGKGVTSAEIYRQAFLFEALGRNVYQPAAEALRIYIPKDSHRMGDLARASAIWALGKILQGSQDEGLTQKLAQRMHDESLDDPEFDIVRYNSTIAIGWIGAPSGLDELQRVQYIPPSPLGTSAKWAMEQFKSSK